MAFSGAMAFIEDISSHEYIVWLVLWNMLAYFPIYWEYLGC